MNIFKSIKRQLGRCIWRFSENHHIPLGRFAPTVFGWMMGVKGEKL